MKISRWLVVLLTVISGTLAGQGLAVSQADATTYTSELTGLTIDIGTSGEGAFDPESVFLYEEGGYSQEDILITRGPAMIYISFVQGEETPANWEESSNSFLAPGYLEYTHLASEITPDTSWALFRGTYILDFSEVMYSEFELMKFEDTHFSFVVYTSEDMLFDDLQWIMDNVTVDNTPVLMQTDYSHLEPYLAGTGDVEPQLITDYVTTVEDWEGAGLESDQAWTSPQFGTSVAWDATWQFPFAKDSAIVIDEELKRDSILLVTPDLTGDVGIYVTQADAEFATPQDWIDRWTSDEWIAGFAPRLNFTVTDTIVTETSAAVIFEGTSRYGEPIVLIYDVAVAEDGTTIITVIRAAPENIGTVYEQFINGVTINGESVPLSWPLEDIQALPVN